MHISIVLMCIYIDRQIHMYPYMYKAHIYVCAHVYKIDIYSWHWMNLSEVHEERKPPVSLIKGFCLDSILTILTIYGVGVALDT